ncbi:MAG: fused MFS/spermidine synthase [Thermoguttaceae bacterium]
MHLFYAAALGLSAALLFALEPMFAKMVLPLLGGSPSVWNTCLLFYQAALLGGYVYAHLAVRWLGPRRQAAVHLAVLFLAWLVLPIGVAHGWNPAGTGHPALWLLLLLTVSVGLPFLCVSATAPLLQAWFAASGHRSARDPYFLYAASNLGSMVGLAAYPLLVEPRLTLAQQSRFWAVGYGLLTTLIAGCAAWLWLARRAGGEPRDAVAGLSPIPNPQSPIAPPPTLRRRLWWLALAAVPSSLLLGVTSYISTDIASVPFLWVMPLMLYLFSFVLVFSRWWPPRRRGWSWALAASLATLGVLLAVASGVPLMFYLFGFVLVLSRWLPPRRGLWWWVLTVLLVTLGVELQVAPGLFPDTAVFQHWLLRPLPLALCLAGSVLALTLLRHREWAWLQAAGMVVLAGVFFLGSAGSTSQVIVLMGIHLAAFFFTAMVCHGELAGDRPSSGHLTEFYLWLSLGGVVGGLFSALLAPVMFRWVLEYPLMLVAACLLRPRPAVKGKWLEAADMVWMATLLTVFALAVWGVPGKHISSMEGKMWLLGLAGLAAFLLCRRPSRFAVAVAILLGVGLIVTEPKLPLYQVRSFFGVIRVEHDEDYDKDGNVTSMTHRLLHGSTLHGVQNLDPEEALQPCSYYDREGPVGDLFDLLEGRRAFRQHGRIGVVGLGTGTLAAYGLPGQHFTFFEIDPTVEQIARNPEYFTYLRDSRAEVEVRLGDARLSLVDEPPGGLDVLLVDAFSSDAIPVHLLTREALELYLSRLARRGLLAVHISNRHLDLEPVLGNLAEVLHVPARISNGLESTWVVLGQRGQNLGDLGEGPRWDVLKTDSSQGPWTDDFSNIIGVVDWQLTWDWLPGWKWWHNKKPSHE